MNKFRNLVGEMPTYEVLTKKYSMEELLERYQSGIPEDEEYWYLYDWNIERLEILRKITGSDYSGMYGIHFFESAYINECVEKMTLDDAIQCLAIKEGADIVRFENGRIGFVSYYGNKLNGFEIIHVFH